MSIEFCHGLSRLAVVCFLIGLGAGNLVLAPVANATSITGSDLNAALEDRLFSDSLYDYETIDPGDNATPARGMSARNRLFGNAPVPDEALNDPVDMILGGADLIELVKGGSGFEFTKLESDFSFNSASFRDWKFLLFDFSAVAIASFIPEIRFWLEGNRWAYFGSSQNGFRGAGGFEYGSEDKITVGSAQASPQASASGNTAGSGQSGTPGRTDIHSRSLSEFVSDMFFKLVRLPITYVILFIGLTVFVINLNRQSRI
jgi:hypothetical protein